MDLTGRAKKSCHSPHRFAAHLSSASARVAAPMQPSANGAVLYEPGATPLLARVAERRSEGSRGPRSTVCGVGTVPRRVATPDGHAVFRRRYATRSRLGDGSVDWKSTATFGHRYAVDLGRWPRLVWAAPLALQALALLRLDQPACRVPDARGDGGQCGFEGGGHLRGEGERVGDFNGEDADVGGHVEAQRPAQGQVRLWRVPRAIGRRGQKAERGAPSAPPRGWRRKGRGRKRE